MAAGVGGVNSSGKQLVSAAQENIFIFTPLSQYIGPMCGLLKPPGWFSGE